MTRLFDLVGPFAPALVFVLAAAESAAFVGFLIPGELAVILGGVAAGTGAVSLWLMIPAAVLGAVVGDSVGYSLGHRMGPTLLSRPKMRRVSARMDAAAALLAERGWWALVVARFAAFLRAVVPFAAGLGKMPYRRFLLGNAIGGALWGTAFTLVGYAAGTNYPKVERWFRAGGLAVVVLVALVGGIVWVTRWAERNRQAVAERLERAANRRPLRYLAAGIRRSHRPGLTLVVTAVATIVGLWVFGGLIQDILGSEEFFFFDVSTIRYLSGNRIAALIEPARIIDAISTPPWSLVPVLALVPLARRRVRLLGAVVAALVGQWLIVELTSTLIARTPPAATALAPRVDYGFPSGQVALVAAVACLLAWPWGRPAWRITVTQFGAAALVVTLVGAARVLLLVEYPSDVIGGAAVAAAWTLVVCLAFDPQPGRELMPGPARRDRSAS